MSIPTRNLRGLMASMAWVAMSFLASTLSAVQLTCKVNIERVKFKPLIGEAGLKAEILDESNNLVALRNWWLCYTEISDEVRATLPVDANNNLIAEKFTSERACQNVLNTLYIAKSMNRPVEIVFRRAPDNADRTIEALACEDVASTDFNLMSYLHMVLSID